MAEFFERRYAFSVRWQISGDDSDTAHDRRLFYRTLKELLMNAYKHSNAKSAEVMLEITANAIRLSVSDAGVGFDPTSPPNDGRRRLGLVGLNDRIAIAGGRFAIESSRGAGCRVIVVLNRFHGDTVAHTRSEAHTR
jgi:signal transduction histidine kinase